jgi:hypothetical protein
MVMVFAVFTVTDGRVTVGATVEAYALKGAGLVIAAILVGEEGRGRKLGVLSVAEMTPPPRGECSAILAARVNETRSGRPGLVAEDEAPAESPSAIVVLRTTPGYRGGCEHTGDRDGPWKDGHRPVLPRPGRVLCEGYTAQGAAGRMGGGEQLVLVLPAGEVLRIGRSGRLYGAPAAHYLAWTGRELVSVTTEERGLLPDDHPLALRKEA